MYLLNFYNWFIIFKVDIQLYRTKRQKISVQNLVRKLPHFVTLQNTNVWTVVNKYAHFCILGHRVNESISIDIKIICRLLTTVVISGILYGGFFKLTKQETDYRFDVKTKVDQKVPYLYFSCPNQVVKPKYWHLLSKM